MTHAAAHFQNHFNNYVLHLFGECFRLFLVIFIISIVDQSIQLQSPFVLRPIVVAAATATSTPSAGIVLIVFKAGAAIATFTVESADAIALTIPIAPFRCITVGLSIAAT